MAGLDTFVRIPKERVGILIGPEGKVKQHIEEKLQTQRFLFPNPSLLKATW